MVLGAAVWSMTVAEARAAALRTRMGARIENPVENIGEHLFTLGEVHS